MDIGTAKVIREERELLEAEYRIEHYLFDEFEPSQNINVAVYAKRATNTIKSLIQNGTLPILCGGSGLYIQSVIDGFKFQKVDLNLREELEKRWDYDCGETLWNELENKDRETAKTLQKENKRRVVRALEVIYSTQNKYQEKLPQFEHEQYAFKNTLQIGIGIEKAELDKRIEKRAKKMREKGLLEEVTNLKSELSVTAKKAIGYFEILAYLNGEVNKANGKTMTIDDAFLQIEQHTKRLTRRQMSWFKRDQRINWI